MRRSITLLTLLAAIVAGHAAQPHPSLPPPVIPDCLGVTIHFTEPKPGEIEMLAAAGFKWVRTDLDWAVTEPRKGQYDFSAYDRLAAALAPFKIRVVFVLGRGHPLYAGPGEAPPFTRQAHTPEFREAFGRWAAAALKHFQRRGFLWELGDEPNSDSWRSPDRVGDYIALAKSTGEHLRQAGLIGPKGEALIGPGTAAIDVSFIEACCQAGLLEYWDAVSVHPFRQSAPETAEDEYRKLRLLLRAYAPKEKAIPIVASDCGYSDSQADVTPDLKADYLGRYLLANIANDVALSIWHDWRDDDLHPRDGAQRFNLVGKEYHPGHRLVFDPSPAYFAMKTISEHLDHFRYNKRLSFSAAPNEFVLLFEREKEIRLAAWSAGTSPASIEIPANRGAVLTFATNGAKTDGVIRDAKTFPFLPAPQVTVVTFPQPNRLLQTAASITRLPLEMVFEMPGDSPPFRFAFTNVSRDGIVGRVLQREDSLERPGVSGLTPDFETVRPHGAMVTNLTVTSWQRALDGVGGANKLVIGVGVDASARTDSSQEATFFQETRLIPAKPWIITRLPDTAGDVVIKLENPSGQPWDGTVQVATSARSGSSGWWGPGKPPKTKIPPAPSAPVFVSSAVPFVLRPNVHTVVFHIPAEAGLGGRTWWRGFDELIFMPPTGKQIEAAIADNGPVILDIPNVQIVADGDPKVPLKFSREIVQPPGGPVAENIPSIRATYSFSPGWKCLRVVNPTWPPPGEKDLLGQPRSMSLWIYGDGQGCVSGMRFVDATNQFFQSTGPKVDWTGWRQVTFPMHRPEDALEHWGGADDGVIHYPIELDSILVLDNVRRAQLEGTVYISAPTLNF